MSELVSISLINWISDTRSQGCTDLQSLITCLDHEDIMAQYAVMQGCVRLRDATELHLYLEVTAETCTLILNLSYNIQNAGHS